MSGIAYLVNQYPKGSHSFIRREILALEKQNIGVTRFSIRNVPIESLVDEEDIKESNETIVILEQKTSFIVRSIIKCFIDSPQSFLRTFFRAVRHGNIGSIGIVKCVAYFLEACVLKYLSDEKSISHIHSHFGTNSTSVAMYLKALGGPSYSFTIHGPEEFDDPKGLLLKEKVTSSEFVIAVSCYGRSQIMRLVNREIWNKIHVVHCGVDYRFLAKGLNKAQVGNNFLCIGRLVEQKGQLLLLEAIGVLKNRGCKFHVTFAGDGPLRGVMEKRIDELEIQDYTRITGWLTSDEIKELLLNSKAMLLPSFAEGLPVSIMESFGLCTPVLSTYVAGIPELVKNGINGWLVAPGDIESLVNCIEKVIKLSDDKIDEMGCNGHREVVKSFDAEKEADKLKKLYYGCGIIAKGKQCID